MDAYILIVDDSPALVNTLTNILTHEGYRIEKCDSGETAWRRLLAGSRGLEPMPDLILLDLNLPGIDGLTFLHRMRADERFERIPVIILTAQADFETRIEALEAGANDYLAKPVQTVDLLARVKALVSLKLAERRHQHRMESLIQAGRVILSTLNLDEVLHRAMQIARTELGAEGGSVWLLGRDGTVTCRAAVGTHSESLPGTRLRREQGIVGWIVEHGETVMIGNVQNDMRFFAGIDEQTGFQTRTMIGAPLMMKETPIGVIEIVNKADALFTLADLSWLQALASPIAAAIENAHLYQELRQHAGQLEERVRQRTAEVQDQYAHMEAILRSASDGIIVTDDDGDILQANPVAQSWLTQTLVPQEADQLRIAVQSLAQRAQERPQTTLELKGLDLELRAAPVVGNGSPAHSAVVAIHDISHLKALSRVKSEFVTNVSHELRTPVTTIRLYVSLLRQSPPEKWPEYLDAISREVDRQARLVENVLQISRIESGRLELAPYPTPLNQLTQTAITSHQLLAQNAGLTLEHLPQEPSPVVLVDPSQMMNVLNNLVVNAIQYTPRDGQVVVSTGRQERQGRTWGVVRVVDSGLGISTGEITHIFERFFRGSEPRQMQTSGTGLGLSIVKEIVELHGGLLTVDSVPGEGSAFVVWLPLSEIEG